MYQKKNSVHKKLPVSLIITILNEENAIVPFLESVLSQSALPSEIVMCDGGSVDRTQDLIRGWNTSDPKVILVVEPGATIARGRNCAVEKASYHIIAVSDAGCELYSDWFEKITEPLLADSSIDVVSGGYIIGWKSPFQRIVASSEIKVQDIPTEVYLPSSRSFAFRKSSWKDVGGYPEELSFAGEDTAFCLRLKSANKKFAVRLDALVLWHPRATLRTYITQHYLYGIGDGEGGVRSWFYRKIIIKNIVALFLIALGIVTFWFFGILILAVIGYFIHLYPIYRWREIPFISGCAAFWLIAIKEWSLFTGWVTGMIRSRRKRA